MRNSLRILLVLSSLLPCCAGGQTTVSSASDLKGDSLRQLGLFAESFDAYRQDIISGKYRTAALFNLACAFAVSGHPDSAFVYIDRYLAADKRNVSLAMLRDDDFYALAKDPRWAQTEGRVMDIHQAQHREKILNEDYALQLYRLMLYDQHYRRDLLLEEKMTKSRSLERARTDSLNGAKLQGLVRQFGWPRKSTVGSQAASYACVMLLHSTLARMKQHYAEIDSLCKAGEAGYADLALLYDRIAIYEGRPQRYGSQVFLDKKSRTWKLHPIENEEGVAARRAAAGLPPLSEYLDNWKIAYVSPRGRQRQGTAVLRSGGSRPDSVFRQGTEMIFSEKSFMSSPAYDRMPLGWAIRSLESQNAGVEITTSCFVGELADKQCLVVKEYRQDSIFLTRFALSKVRNNTHSIPLPYSFTVECDFFLEDSACARNAPCEFGIYFKNPLSPFKNELNIRIARDGRFEMNADAGDPRLGKNTIQAHEWSYNSVVRASGQDSKYHRELKGVVNGFDIRNWHTVALSYDDNTVRGWIDGRFIGSLATDVAPLYMWLFGTATFGIRNIHLAADPPRDTALSVLANTGVLSTQAIYFRTGSAVVESNSFPFLRELAQWLTLNKAASLEITGHTDNTGDSSSNYTLSMARAEAIKAILCRSGIAGSRIKTSGRGQDEPVAPNDTEANKARNRRIAFRIVKPS